MANFKEKFVEWSHRIAKEQEFKAGYDVQVLQVSGEGYSSANFKICISEPNRELKMFAKVATINEDLRKTSYSRLFKDEFYFYNDIVKIFRELENRHNIPERDRFRVSKFYGGDPTSPEETIILEDLSHQGFAIHDQSVPFDWEYASKTVEQLAKFNALSFVYGIERPSEFAKLLESKPYHVFDSPLMKRLGFDATVPMSVGALEGELRARVGRYLAAEDRHRQLVRLYRSAAPRVLAHGDFKTNNLMHRRHEGNLEVIPVDFQNIHAGSPATDLLYLVMLGSGSAFRASSLPALLDHYHDQLTRALARMNVRVEDVYPKSVFEEDWKQALPIGLAVALMMLPYLMPTRTGDQPSAAFAERVQGVVRDYISWGVL